MTVNLILAFVYSVSAQKHVYLGMVGQKKAKMRLSKKGLAKNSLDGKLKPHKEHISGPFN